MFLMGIQEAEGKRIVTVLDIPNAFVITKHKRAPTVIIRIQGKVPEILLRLHPDVYKDYVVYKNRVPMIYVEILKALHELIEALLLYYYCLKSDLVKDRFVVNLYNPCVTNKIGNLNY